MNPSLANQAPGLAHYWSQGDIVTHLVAYVLLLMSIASWYYILSKAWSAWRIRKSASALEGFWKAANLDDAIIFLKSADGEKVFSPLATQSIEAANVRTQSDAATSLNATSELSELITRTLRQEINRVSARLESGLAT